MGLLAGDGSPMGPTLFRGPTHRSRVGPNPRPAGGDPHPQMGIPAGVQMSRQVGQLYYSTFYCSTKEELRVYKDAYLYI
jgi:hypothetical protein